ncbi:hypothetical protein EZV62_005636 [Acer yangbiense]|uniref:DUF7610 domain-containing protein n=1 Tax=Acer yangbiense TaxID=1000413 RepID=A0A5C7IN60_9ROSI|nr:hypothetical protein EZV62_005636 [Acer yangbiense]
MNACNARHFGVIVNKSSSTQFHFSAKVVEKVTKFDLNLNVQGTNNGSGNFVDKISHGAIRKNNTKALFGHDHLEMKKQLVSGHVPTKPTLVSVSWRNANHVGFLKATNIEEAGSRKRRLLIATSISSSSGTKYFNENKNKNKAQEEDAAALLDYEMMDLYLKNLPEKLDVFMHIWEPALTIGPVYSRPTYVRKWHVHVVNETSPGALLSVHCKSGTRDLRDYAYELFQRGLSFSGHSIRTCSGESFTGAIGGRRRAISMPISRFSGILMIFIANAITRTVFWVAKDLGFYLKDIPDGYDEFRSYSILQKKLQELETQLTEAFSLPPEAPYRHFYTQEIDQKFVFLNTLLSAEIASTSPKKPFNLNHIAQRVVELEAEFREWDNGDVNVRDSTIVDDHGHHNFETGSTCSYHNNNDDHVDDHDKEEDTDDVVAESFSGGEEQVVKSSREENNNNKKKRVRVSSVGKYLVVMASGVVIGMALMVR